MILGVAFVFGAVVLIHELGHFIVAKWQDVEVEAFAIGFGPPVVSVPYGETEYRICWLPLGGYVKMAGEDPSEAGDDPRSFYNKSVGSRILILLAGGVFNLLLGYMLYVPYGMIQGEEVIPPEVGYVSADAPANGVLEVGDRILTLNGEPIKTYQEFQMNNELLGDQERVLEIERDGERRTVEIEPKRIVREQFRQPSYIIGIQPLIEPRVSRVLPDGLAAQAGFQPGDVIRSAGGESIRSWPEFMMLLQQQEGDIPIEVQRDDERIPLTLSVPEDLEEAPPLGIAPDVPVRTFGFFESFGWAGRRTMQDIVLMYEAVAGLLGQTLAPESLAGPIGIFQMTGQMAALGIAPLIRFTAFFSINLGILNLLPIPILDGGHILLSLPELFTGKPLPERVIGMVNYIGLFLLLTMLIFVTYIDLRRFETLREWINMVPGLGG